MPKVLTVPLYHAAAAVLLHYEPVPCRSPLALVADVVVPAGDIHCIMGLHSVAWSPYVAGLGPLHETEGGIDIIH